jgi:hypothetical protein
MNRATTGLCLAAAVGLAVSAGAQMSSSRAGSGQNYGQEDISVTGCLQRGSADNFILIDAQASAAPNIPTGTSGTNASPAVESARWDLEDRNQKLDSYVGQKVEVVGHPSGTNQPMPGIGDEDPSAVPQASSLDAGTRELVVKAVQRISRSCS